jgi:perosamine synthetase
MHSDKFIPVAAPSLEGNEAEYVMDCIKSSWISSTGKYIEQFEELFASFCGVKHAITCSNGTTALHLALLALDLQPDEEVLVPTLTFVASANAVVYCGAKPVFVDVEPDIWTIDPGKIEQKITPRTRGIIAVHLAGHPAAMSAILAIAKRHNLWVLEDAAQAHGAEVNGKKSGAMGDVATFSFFGNKIITTGEGGMVTTNDDAIAAKVRILKNHGMDPRRRYWHPMVGYNYRMTNIQAAIGVAQMEQISNQLEKRKEIVEWYRQELQGVPGITWQQERSWARHVWWMFTAVLGEEFDVNRDELMVRMRERGIETRPVVYPMHQLPPYRAGSAGEQFPVADRLSHGGVNLPTWVGVTRDDVRFICQSFLEIAAAPGRKTA